MVWQPHKPVPSGHWDTCRSDPQTCTYSVSWGCLRIFFSYSGRDFASPTPCRSSETSWTPQSSPHVWWGYFSLPIYQRGYIFLGMSLLINSPKKNLSLFFTSLAKFHSNCTLAFLILALCFQTPTLYTSQATHPTTCTFPSYPSIWPCSAMLVSFLLCLISYTGGWRTLVLS